MKCFECDNWIPETSLLGKCKWELFSLTKHSDSCHNKEYFVEASQETIEERKRVVDEKKKRLHAIRGNFNKKFD